jgi:hypothetical protein
MDSENVMTESSKVGLMCGYAPQLDLIHIGIKVARNTLVK